MKYKSSKKNNTKQNITEALQPVERMLTIIALAILAYEALESLMVESSGYYKYVLAAAVGWATIELLTFLYKFVIRPASQAIVND